MDFKMSDRDMLLLAFGALRAVGFENKAVMAVGDMIEEHLFPTSEPEVKTPIIKTETTL